jgi:hypothetical protein
MDVEDADEGVLEGDLVRVGGDADRVEGVVFRLRSAHGDGGSRRDDYGGDK